MNRRLQDFLSELFEGKDYSWIYDTETKIMYFRPKEVLLDCGYDEGSIKNKVSNLDNRGKKFFTNDMLNSESFLKLLRKPSNCNGYRVNNNGALNNAGEYWVTVYALIDMLQGRKPKATEIKNWLIYEVLPSLNENGYYIAQDINSDQLDKLQAEVDELKNQVFTERTKRAYGSTEIVKLIKVPNLLSSSLLRYLAEIGLGTYEVAKKNRVFKPNYNFYNDLVSDERSLARLSVGNGIIFFEEFANAINRSPKVLKRLSDINIEELDIKNKGIENKLPF